MSTGNVLIDNAIVALVLAFAVISFVRSAILPRYAKQKESELKKRIKKKNLLEVPDMPLEQVAEQLKEMLPFNASKYEFGKSWIKASLFVEGVKSRITVMIEEKEGYFVVKPLAPDNNLDWNVASQVEEALSVICGKKDSVSDQNNEFEFNEFEFEKLKRRDSLRRKLGWVCRGLTALGVLCVAVMIFQKDYIPDHIGDVKSAVLPETSDPIGTVFDEFFGEQEWKNAKANVDGYAFVVMDGACYFETPVVKDSRRKVDVSIDFLINPETGMLMVHNISVDGAKLDSEAQTAFLEDVYTGHMAQKSFSSLQDVLSDFADNIGNGIRESYMGHYVSYYSAESGTGEEAPVETAASESVADGTEKTIVGRYKTEFGTSGGAELEIQFNSAEETCYAAFRGSYLNDAGEVEGILSPETDGTDGMWVLYDSNDYTDMLRIQYDGQDTITVVSLDGNNHGGMQFPGFAGTYTRIE